MANEEHLQIENRITRLEERVSEMDKATGILQVLLERSMEVQEKLAGTMTGISDTMVSIKITMGAMQAEMVELHKEVATERDARKEEDARLHSKIGGVENAVKVMDDNSKINWVELVKKWAINLLAGGAIVALAEYIFDVVIKH